MICEGRIGAEGLGIFGKNESRALIYEERMRAEGLIFAEDGGRGLIYEGRMGAVGLILSENRESGIQ